MFKKINYLIKFFLIVSIVIPHFTYPTTPRPPTSKSIAISSTISYPNVLPPRTVYRATPFTPRNTPQNIFRTGFERPRDRRVELAAHVLGFTGDPSGLISTTADRDYAVYYGSNYASSTWNANEFYVYVIVPDRNFISVRDNFELALQHEGDDERRRLLEGYRWFFTREDEYSALYRIPPERIISATRYERIGNSHEYARREEIVNNITRVDRNTPSLTASIYNRPYSLGSLRGENFYFDAISPDFGCYDLEQTSATETTASVRKKRSLGTVKIKCPNDKERQKFNFYDNPSKFIEENKFQIPFDVFGYNLCMNHNNKDITFKKCSDSAYWTFTKFGQLISEVNDGKNQQYYCLTSPNKNIEQGYAKMEICDLNKEEQFWEIKKANNNKNILQSSHSKFIMHSYSYYGYMYKKYVPYWSINIINDNIFKTHITKPLIQFSINSLKSGSLTLYPAANGYVYSGDQSSLTEYKNFYNAHNQGLFSSYGHGSRGPQTCYNSQLLKNGGYTWDMATNTYCSTMGYIENHLKWFFTFYKRSKNHFLIRDYQYNILKIDKVTASFNKNYAYTSSPRWVDTYSFLNQFKLDQSLVYMAKPFTRDHKFKLTKEQSLLEGYSNLKDFFYKKLKNENY